MPLIRFGEFQADPVTQELHRDGRRVRLPPQSFQVLLKLVGAPGALVTREALQAELWPATSQVEYEQGLNAAINRLREALGDSAAEPRYIETLPRRGYRFIGTLTPEAPPPVPVPREPAPTLTTAPATDPKPEPKRRRPALYAGLLASIAVLAIVAWQLMHRSGSEQPGRLVPYTALAGEERAPAFSPDGTRLAFAWNGDAANAGKFDLYVKAADSEHLLRVTNSPARWIHPAWSPDGKFIAFTRSAEPESSGVFLVPSMGGAERRLATASFANPSFMQIAWSRDGKSIAYAAFDENGSHVIRVLDVETLRVEPLEHPAGDCWHAGMPASSDDGARLAFVCTTSIGVYDVFVRTPAADLRHVATVMGEPQGLAWDADDRSLIVANDAGDGGGLWRLAPDGTMTRLPFGEEGSAPTRHGNDVAYVRAHQSVDIWRMDLAARGPEKTAQRLIGSTRSDITPQYSPDGTRIVFQSNRSGSTEIWMADADGANPVRLTEFNGPLAGAPQWCSDGKRVAFDARSSGTSSIWIVDVDARRPQRLASTNAQNSLPAWSADCASILASDGRDRLFKLPVGGGPAVRFTDQDSYLAQVNGAEAIYNSKQSAGVALWTRPLAGGDEHALPGMPSLEYTDAWAVAPRGVYYTSTIDGVVTLRFYDFQTRATRRIATLPKPPAPGGGLGLAVSRDGRWLLYTRAGEAQSDIMLMDNP